MNVVQMICLAKESKSPKPKFFLFSTFALALALLASAVAQSATLVVGSEQDSPPFATGSTDATAGGFTVDLWKAVAAETGLSYTIRVRPLHQLQQEFKEGKIDVLLNFAQSSERHQFADFSVPHSNVQGAVFVRKGQSKIKVEEDLAGKSIIVMMSADLARNYAVAKGWGQQLVFVETVGEGFRLLAAGQHDAMLNNKLTGLQTLQALALTNIEPLKVPAGFSLKFAFAVQPGQAQLLATINDGLALTMVNGTYNALYQKWFDVYKLDEVGLNDLWRYILPTVALFLTWVGYLIYRRQAERHLARAAIAASRDLLLTIIDTAPVRVFWKDRNLRYLGCNAVFARDAGMTHPHEVIGKDDYQLGWATQADIYRAHDKTVMETGNAMLSYDEALRTPSGQTIWFRKSKVPLKSQDNTTIGVLGIYEDITERKLAEEKLSQLSIAVEQSPASVVITDLTACIEYVNPRFTEVTGYSAAEAIGQNPRILQSKLTPVENFRTLWRQLSHGQSWTGEFINRRKNGEIYWEESQIVPVKNPAGTVTHFVAVKTDITLRKRLEAEREEALNRLQKIASRLPGMVYQYLLRPDGRACFPFASEAIRDIYRVSPEDVREDATKVFAVIHPDDHAGFIASIQNSAADLTPWHHEYRVKFDDGTENWLQGNASPERETDGSVLWHGFITDVTERKHLREQVRQMARLDAQAKSKAAQDKINHLAFYDPLTLLPNRRLLLDRLQLALAASERSRLQGAMLFVDLDDFKTPNDALGHDKGDFLLQQVSQSLLSCVREGDTVARLGGDEFVVLMEDLSQSALEAATQAETLAEKILFALNQTYQLGDYRHHSTASIGITLFDGTQKENLEEPMKQAELAMYQAKSAGRNTLRFFDPQMQSVVSARAALEMNLREALEKNQFMLYYQPQVTGDGRIKGVEALVRWLDPVRGLIAPAEFIPLAEETGLILPLGSWVLETACTQLARWARQSAFAQLTVAVNVSARQFHQSDFVEQVLAALARTGANPYRLKLELTESLLVLNVEEVIAKMSALKGKGVGFSLDDFGTGYSSLSYLKRLPLDQLKIDQGFVKNILIDANDAAIARMVVALAESMGLSVIAEGVETEDQREILAGLGCHDYQGYLFGRPLPLQEFEAVVNRV